MPSPQAQLLTLQHRRELAAVVAAIVARLARIGQTADLVDIDRWWEQVSPTMIDLVVAGHSTTATLASRYLRQHSAIEGSPVEPRQVAPDRARLETSLLVTGPVAFKKNLTLTGDENIARRVMVDRLRGSGTRLVLAGARDTVTSTVTSSDRIAGMRRVTTGSPCAFCAMVASRGAVYKADTALRRPSFHDNDNCTYQPLYEREPEPPQVTRLRETWNETTDGLSGLDALNAFRRQLEGV